MGSLFDSCRERIERARVHLQAATDVWNGLNQKDFHSVRCEQYSERGLCLWVKQTRPFPSAIPMFLGEMLYHLSAALDGAVYAAVCQQAGGEPKGQRERRLIRFPVCKAEPDFWGQVGAGQLGPEPLSQARAGIIESMQRYHAIESDPSDLPRAISILGQWSIVDRHRRLHVVGSQPATLGLPDFSPRLEVAVWKILAAVFREEESIFALCELAAPPVGTVKVEAELKMALEICIDEEPRPSSPNDLTSVRIRAMFEAVETLIDRLEGSFLAAR